MTCAASIESPCFVFCAYLSAPYLPRRRDIPLARPSACCSSTRGMPCQRRSQPDGQTSVETDTRMVSVGAQSDGLPIKSDNAATRTTWRIAAFHTVRAYHSSYPQLFSLILVASAMASNLPAMASTLPAFCYYLDGLQPTSDGLHPTSFLLLVAMASNLLAMASTLLVLLLVLVAMASNLLAMSSTYSSVLDTFSKKRTFK